VPESDQVSSVWRRFVQACRKIAAPLAEHRHEDQFLRAQEAAFALAESDQMVREMVAGYTAANALKPTAPAEPNVLPSHPSGLETPAAIVAIELESLPNAVAIYEATVKAGSAKPGALENLRRIGKTVLGSVGEVFMLSEWGKRVLAVLKEALEFSGKE
jgi:hypothetical protein